MKKIIIIILSIVLIGVIGFSVYYIVIDKILYRNDFDTMLSEEQVEYKTTEEIQEEAKSQKNIKETVTLSDDNSKIEQEWDRTGEWLKFFNMTEFFEVICNKNQDWHIGDTTQRAPYILVENYVTDKFLEKYNQEDGILGDIGFTAEKITVEYNPFTQILTVFGNVGDIRGFVQMKVNYVVEDNKHLVDSIKFLAKYPNDSWATPLCIDTYEGDFLNMLYNAYIEELDEKFETSEDFREKFPDNKIFGDEEIFEIDLWKDENENTSDYNNKIINIAVRKLEDDTYYWYNYIVKFELNEDGCLTNCEYQLKKKLKSYKLGKEPIISTESTMEEIKAENDIQVATQNEADFAEWSVAPIVDSPHNIKDGFLDIDTISEKARKKFFGTKE